MSDSYSVRIRGRVHGPMSSDKLRELIRKGQVGRMHEVSDDGVTWASASTIPELFSVHAAAPQADGQPQDGQSSESGEWYFSGGGESEGPFSVEKLQSLARSGRLLPTDKVWSPDHENWVEAVSAVELQSHFAAHLATAPNGGSDKLASIGQVLEENSKWLFFLALFYLITGIPILITGVVGLAGAGVFTGPPAFHLGVIANGALMVYFGHLFLTANRKTGVAATGQTSEQCLDAIRSLNKIFFVFSLVLIAVTAGTILVMVILASLGSTFEWGEL